MSQMTPLNKIVTELESGSRPTGGIKANTIGVPSVGAEHLNDQGNFNFNKVKFIPNSFFESQKRGIIKVNDILIVKDGATTGKTSFVDESFPFKRASLNEHVFRLAVDEKIANPKYIFWYLFSNYGKKQIMNNFRGSTIGGITKEFVGGVQLNLPGLEEQNRIVKILDIAQSFIEKRKQAISYLDDYIKAVFLDMFGDPVSNPKGWDIKSIKTISHKITDGEHLNPTFSEAGMPMIMAGHVLESGVDTKSARKVPSEIGEFFRRKCNPEKNDLLLVSRGATIGRLCRVTTSELFCLMGSVILIKPDQDIVNSAFLSELLKHPRMYSNLFNSSGSSAQQAIYLKDIKKLDCIIPPIDDQRNFEKIVLEVDSIKQKMQSQLEELENNFQAQLQRAFRGG